MKLKVGDKIAMYYRGKVKPDAVTVDHVGRKYVTLSNHRKLPTAIEIGVWYNPSDFKAGDVVKYGITER